MAIIAICDDNQMERNLVRAEIEKYNLLNKKEKFTIREFESSKNLWFEASDANIADIFLLDVDMPEMDGFELAQKIRENNSKAIIIFLTSHFEFASKGYKVEAFRYIHKLNMEKELIEALESAIDQLHDDINLFLPLKHGDDYIRVPFADIRYVQRVNRQLEIHTKNNGILLNNQGIKELYEKLDSSRFIFIDRSCFVNIDYIIRIVDGNVWISSTEEKLPISRRLQANVKSAIAKGWKLT